MHSDKQWWGVDIKTNKAIRIQRENQQNFAQVYLESDYSDYWQQAFPKQTLKIYYFYLKLWIAHLII